MPEEFYDYVTATISCGQIYWRYQIHGLDVPGSQSFNDEDVSEWTDKDIVDLTCNMLDIPESEKHIIKVVWN